jgi:hypothetical protein
MAKSRRFDESKVTRDANGRFVSWSMDIQVGGQRVQSSGPDARPKPSRPAPSPYPPALSPSHQNMMDLNRQLRERMIRDLRNNTISPTEFSYKRRRSGSRFA